MNYNEALEYIHGVCWMGSRLGLERTYELMHKLGDPQKDLKFIHIAGTNGKGSVCAFLTAALMEAEKTCGTFTSPHLSDIRERFLINGRMVPEEAFLAAFEAVYGYVSKW